MSSIYSKPVCDLAWENVGYSQYDGKHTKFAADLDAVATALSNGTMIYAGIATDGSGYWQMVGSKPSAGPVGQIIEVTTMPDGQPAVKIQVLEA